MAGFKKPTVPTQSSYNSLYVNPLNDPKNEVNQSLGSPFSDNKENVILGCDKENAVPANGFCSVPKQSPPKLKPLGVNGSCDLPKQTSIIKCHSTGKALKPSSLQLCMQMDEPDKAFKSRMWETTEQENSSSLSIWDYSDSEAAPASSWSTLTNRALLCRPLPVDVGKCTCFIVKEASPVGLDGGSLYSLYTNEGHGRQDRKLAVAHHKRHNGKSEFTVAQNMRGVFSNSDDSFIGIVAANFMGSKYQIWDQTSHLNSLSKQSNPLVAVVTFMPTISTWTGSYRSMRAYIPKHQSMVLKSATQLQHISGLPNNWETTKMNKVHKLYSRTPRYNKISKQYELDFRDRGRAGFRIQSSVKNFQMKLEENGKQTILQLGRVDKTKFVMDFRYPLTGYQAFCICLASIDSKLCCTV